MEQLLLDLPINSYWTIIYKLMMYGTINITETMEFQS